ncbi:prestin-like [Euwallacea similis]|uniref:prestin-like n=1 Tax=Euwallacea similis TaxID=1736056 RepID=UPI00344B50D4
MENPPVEIEEEVGRIRIERPYYEHKQIRNDFAYHKAVKRNALKKYLQEFRLTRLCVSIFPPFDWLVKYSWKRSLLKDVVAGITVAIMHIPQGMAYAMLGNVPPVVGIYMAFFPVLAYFMFGTSRHNSMGTFSVACLMTGKAVLEYSDPSYFSVDSSHNMTTEASITDAPAGYSPIEVATSVTFIVALFQLGMYVLRLGAVSALLSDTLVSGFTTGAAVHVLVSQMKDLFGLHIPKFKGNFTNVNTIWAIFGEISKANIAALIISFITTSVSVINNEVFKPLVSKVSPIPVPIELIAVVIGTLVSKYCNLESTYGVKVVGDIPAGLPLPALPVFGLLPSLIVDGLTIAMVTYTINLSMALIFAQKLEYEIDANQELLAMGISNTVGSFFSCMPLCASLSRSLIQQVVGGVSQIASLVSCLILLVILLWIGPFFEPLPTAVLASVIIVALKGMLWQVLDFWTFWKLSKIDALVWMGTFLTVALIGIDIGLICGIALSLTSIFILNLRPYTCLLGEVADTDFYLDIKRYRTAKEIEGIKIFHYSGGINFATRFMFKADLIRLIGINPQKEVVRRGKISKYFEKIDQNQKSKIWTRKLARIQNKINTELKCLILDFSSVSHIDPSGVGMVKSITDNFRKLGIAVYIAGSKEPIYEILMKVYPDTGAKSSFTAFPTLHDAVHFAKHIFESSTISVMSSIRI